MPILSECVPTNISIELDVVHIFLQVVVWVNKIKWRSFSPLFILDLIFCISFVPVSNKCGLESIPYLISHNEYSVAFMPKLVFRPHMSASSVWLMWKYVLLHSCQVITCVVCHLTRTNLPLVCPGVALSAMMTGVPVS